MLLYEMFAIGIAVALVVAAIGRLAARVGPEETALLREARPAVAQRRLVTSAAQQERDARAAAAQRRLVAAAAQRRLVAAAAQRAAPAQRRLVAAAAQRAAPAQRRLVAAAARQDDWIWRCLKRQYEDALAAPLSPRLATLINQLETQEVFA